MSGKLIFHKPAREELWFREKMLADPVTMSYNDAWGGAVAFPAEDWDDWYEYWIENPDGKRFYRYLESDGEFIGEAAYHLDRELGVHIADVIVFAPYRGKGYGGEALDMLCNAAKENGIDALYDNIAKDNPAISMFLSHGFYEEYRDDGIIMLKKEL